MWRSVFLLPSFLLSSLALAQAQPSTPLRVPGETVVVTADRRRSDVELSS